MKKLIPFLLCCLLTAGFAASAGARPLPADEEPCTHPVWARTAVLVEPTCTEEGLEEETCVQCGEKRQTPVGPLGHLEKTLEGKAPTCTETGLTDGVVCERCEEVLTAQQTLSALGHKEKTVPGKAPTCTETGLTDGVVCERCEEVLTAQETLSALGHQEKTVPGKDPTCTETGRTDGVVCERCEEVLTAQQTLSALGHKEKTVPGKEPTCTETGLTDGVVCERCEQVLTEQQTLSALGHSLTTVPGKPAACTAPGLSDGLICARCGEILRRGSVLPALGHDFLGYRVTTPATWRWAGVETDPCSRCDAKHTRVIPMLTHLPASACPTGDADLDGKVTAGDARFALRLAVGFDDGLDADQVKTANCDGTGSVTAADARAILRISVGMDPFAPDLLPGYTFKGYTAKHYPLAEKDGVTYVVTRWGYILIANKTYSLPSTYAPGDLTPECRAAYNRLVSGASYEGISIFLISGYRSYWTQDSIYNRYVAADGRAAADTYSARPGHSEHQTGLAMDVNSLSGSFAYTREGIWLKNNAHKYGFVIRYGADKQAITGYIYEPWHIRYLGVELATEVYSSGLCLEEFFGITSYYH